MADAIQHKHRAINPSTATPRSDDVDGANWLEEHKVNAPEIGAVLVGDPSQSDGANWVATGIPDYVLTSLGPGSLPVWKPPSGGMVNPMTAAGDLIVGTTGGVPGRLPVGVTTGHVLTVSGAGLLAWAPAPGGGGMSNPMTTAQDLIVGGASGTPTRLGIGANTQVLTVVAGALVWAAPVSGGMTNPMTAVGDLIVGGAAGVANRLAVGINGLVLTLVSGLPAWAAPSGGMANPMTNAGDMIVAGGGGVPMRLPVGPFGYWLTISAGAVQWAPLPVDPGFANPMTTLGDLIVGSTAGLATRLGPGSAAQVLTIVGGVPSWATPAAGGGAKFQRLPLAQADLPNGTTGNLPPEIIRDVSTGTLANAPSPTRTSAAFDGTQDEVLSWSMQIPSDWVSGGTIRGKLKARSGAGGANVIMKAGVAVTIDGVTNDSAVAYTAVDLSAAIAMPATVGQLVEFTIPLTTTNFAVNRWVTIFVGRDADNAADTLNAIDALLMGVRFEYA